MPGNLEERRWFSPTQPQTLQIATVLLYWNAALGLLIGLLTGGFGRLSLILLVADLAGAFGIANERKWGYVVAITASAFTLVLLLTGAVSIAGELFNLIFQIALVVLLVHPMSRAYYKIWFR